MSQIKNYFSTFFVFAVLLGGIWSAFHLEIHENLAASIPNNEDFESFQPVLEKTNQTIIFSLDVQSMQGDLFRIDSAAQTLVSHLEAEFPDELKNFQYRSDLDPEVFQDFIQSNLYIFLGSEDYSRLDSLIQKPTLTQALVTNKENLASPQGFGQAGKILSDPLNFSTLAYQELSKGFATQNLASSQGYYLSSDLSKILVKANLTFDGQDVPLSQEFSEQLEKLADTWNQNPQAVRLDYFGTFLIPVANATQIKADIILTINLALVFIIGLLYFYYRRLSTILLFVLPGIFGIAGALVFIYLIFGGISALALSASAVIMGIVVDYSFHFFSHLNQEKDPFITRDRIAFPLTISSLTTVVAFFSLTFASSQALQDFGYFTGFSLIFTLVFILFFLPSILQLFGQNTRTKGSPKLNQLIENLGKEKLTPPKWMYVVILGMTGLFAFYAGKSAFESDLHQLNFYPDDLKQKEIAHQNINPDTQKRYTLIAYGKTQEEAIQANRAAYLKLSSSGIPLQLTSLGGLILPKTEQEDKAMAWENFWQKRISTFSQDFLASSDSLGFRKGVYQDFLQNLPTPRTEESPLDFVQSSQTFGELLLQGKNTNLITTLVFEKAQASEIKAIIQQLPNIQLVDGESIAESLVEDVKKDFNLLLLLASGTVFLTLLVVYGRIELTLISFLPMVFSWVWILGLSGIIGLKFNFINIMIATIIFGLGDDFSIFITDGLLAKYKLGRKALATNQAGILLSSISTIIGTGVLFFGQHPAIRSIAGVSVLGISTIVMLNFVIQPLFFRALITRRTDQGKPPYTLLELFISGYACIIFCLGCLITSLTSALLILIPFWKLKSKKRIIHRLIRFFCSVLVWKTFTLKKRYFQKHHLDFSKPSILLVNHSSFLDILWLAMQDSKLILLVTQKVYNSRIFGPIIRFADFLPNFVRFEENMDKIRQLTQDGYSVLFFQKKPSSEDGSPIKLPEEAFYLSEELQLDITPVLLHGLDYALPEGDFYAKRSIISMKVLPRILPQDSTFGNGYLDRSEKISEFFQASLDQFTAECQDPDYLYAPLKSSILYKGPLLEWYFKIKYRREKENYQRIDQALANSKVIYDLGCGYGFLSYFLFLKDRSRKIIGVDSDEEKILLASHNYLKTEQLHFLQEDLAIPAMTDGEAILLVDSLHLLNDQKKLQVLQNCLSCLQNGGVLLIHDEFNNGQVKHTPTPNLEKWITPWIGIDKKDEDGSYCDFKFITQWVEENQLQLEVLSQSTQSGKSLLEIRSKAS